MTWSDAQSHCRQTYTDLSTINDTQDNSQVANTMPSYYMSWIGLYRNWTWSNSSTASNLPWGPGQPDNSLNCATIVGSTGSFNSHKCDDQRPFLCSRDNAGQGKAKKDVKPSASRSVKVQLRVGSADLNDPTVQESILQQVREKLVEQGIREEVKLRWRTQPDGKVFHREEETAAYCEKEDCGGLV
ncbi:C-type lectin BML-2-like isoform X2 [Haplochromis burtoni]|uniref:C-type lectin BML-2-like isoform X2 n=1 Tax=Haplochromis burtoni TaxID=8153 RepID=UPI001C2DE5D0|nr:C-type lectin BML-2-like isoform X2 [Haplochromis burtoni]XP_042073160.1 C-type lectin BML-2-like isoform X2 [Haplochromis burtoni]